MAFPHGWVEKGDLRPETRCIDIYLGCGSTGCLAANRAPELQELNVTVFEPGNAVSNSGYASPNVVQVIRDRMDNFLHYW